ncbi:hypothetical protein D3C83_154240 [compost metagenome]
MRHDDAGGADVECPRNVMSVMGRHAHQWRHADVPGGDAQARGFLDADHAVFHVDIERVEAGGLGDMGDVGQA